MEGAQYPLSGHDLLLLFLQLALLLAVARFLGAAARRIHQPAVIGELVAGILLGPTVMGHYLPGLYAFLFPSTGRALNLLEALSWVGLVYLLLLTGLEVDMARLRRVGRSALLVSLWGLVIPLAAGWLLGSALPDQYLTSPDRRPLFAAFVATAIAIPAMPVIAKILMDLDLLRRNIGILILGTAVVEDTVGWLILSVIAGLAEGAAMDFSGLGLTLGLLAGFLVIGLFVIEPLLQRLFRWVDDHFHGTGMDMTLVAAFTFVSAATTESIGVHAVFGAFAAGVILRQIPRLRSETLHTVEQFVHSALAPIFFAYVGLRVDLWSLTGWTVPLLFLGVAIGVKWLGCEVGGRLGGLGIWERLGVGIAMSVRGAMGLVVALIGLSLGLLTEEMYSIIVGVAVVTSALAPVALPFIIPRIPLTDEERRRIEAGELRRVFRREGAKLLVPTAGGPHAEAAFRVAAVLSTQPGASLTALYVETGRHRAVPLRRLARWLGAETAPLTPIEEHLQRLRAVAEERKTSFDWRTVRARSAPDAIIAEAERGYDILFLGAPASAELEDPGLARLLTRARCHVAIVRAAPGRRDNLLRHILVPTDGSFFARAALEFAVNLAEATGGRVTVFTVLPERESEGAHGSALSGRRRLREVLKGAVLGPALKPVTALTDVPVDVRLAHSDRPGEAIILEALSSDYDLIVLGAENKALARPLFYGQGTQYVLENTPCDAVVVVPKL